MKIREGAYYRTRGGDVIGPLSAVSWCDRTFSALDLTWHEDGSYVQGVPGNLDLISEVYVSDTPLADAPAPTETKTHDYTRRSWGHNFTITEIFNGGMWLDMMGWGHGLSKGDFIILPNGNETTQYLIKDIEYKSNPPDMWRAKVEFAPRARLARDVREEREGVQ